MRFAVAGIKTCMVGDTQGIFLHENLIYDLQKDEIERHNSNSAESFYLFIFISF